MEKKLTRPTKRQQIAQSNRMMFLWIAGVSMVVGFAIVLAIFLVQRIVFEEKVLSKKQNTISVLEKNITAYKELQNNIQVLESDENLSASRYEAPEKNTGVVLDALPSTANSTALASSLQSKILAGVPGVAIDSLKVEPVSGVETTATAAGNTSNNNSAEGTISFTFSVSTPIANQSALREVLLRVERSIRPVNITGVTIESQGDRVVLTASGVGYYEPETKVQLIKEVVRP